MNETALGLEKDHEGLFGRTPGGEKVRILETFNEVISHTPYGTSLVVVWGRWACPACGEDGGVAPIQERTKWYCVNCDEE